MVDRGWRRSGTLLYKPDVLRACCPHYTIRLDAASLRASRDQRQAVNRWNKHVLGDEYIKEAAKKFPRTKEEKKRDSHEFDLLQAIHAAELARLKPIQPDHRFEVTLEPDTYTEEKFQLFKNYQTNVHRESPSEVTTQGFRRFLCDSPLLRITTSAHQGKPQLLGSWHQCYRLDGRLIAMAVLDLLPHAVSGVYFIYHQDYEKYSLGKLSALREAAFAVEGGYQYYYMGYYIHACVKMRYKGDYRPQYILDPMTYAWHPLEEFRPMLDHGKLATLLRGASKDEAGERKSDTVGGPAHDDMIVKDDDDFTGPDGTTWRYLNPLDAGNSGQNVLAVRMPGVPTPVQLEEEIDLDDIDLHFGSGAVAKTHMLQTWDDDLDLTHGTLRGAIAELVACLGPEATKTMVVDFARH